VGITGNCLRQGIPVRWQYHGWVLALTERPQAGSLFDATLGFFVTKLE
jgi:hypothetical protein